MPEAAVGRIREIRADADGLKLKRALNEEGKRLTAGDAPAYTAFSPNWGMEPITYQGRKAFRPVYLFSVGLTNRPQIPGTYIGLNEALPAEKFPVNPNHKTMHPKLIALLAALGITRAADATEEQLISGINEALPKATAAVEAQGKLTTAVNETGTLKGQLTAAQGETTKAVNEAAGLRTQLAAEALRAGLPHAVCPKCNGVDSRNGTACRGCRGYGFVPETRFMELSK